MADRRRNQHDGHGPEVALLIGVGIAALLVVHWLATWCWRPWPPES
jgi:hypothetical protein